jgi:hypothetical protein
MKSSLNWNDRPELLERIYVALEEAGFDVYGSDEEGPYGERGTLTLSDGGEHFSLELHILH